MAITLSAVGGGPLNVLLQNLTYRLVNNCAFISLSFVVCFLREMANIADGLGGAC
jgi:hypothetical protein